MLAVKCCLTTLVLGYLDCFEFAFLLFCHVSCLLENKVSHQQLMCSLSRKTNYKMFY